MKRKHKRAHKKEAFLAKRALGRNNKLYDIWSLVHLITGIFLGWVMSPFLALVIMVLWEPLEIFILSPLLARIHIDFGYETIKNSLSDIVFDVIGVSLGYYVLLAVSQPPFHLF